MPIADTGPATLARLRLSPDDVFRSDDFIVETGPGTGGACLLTCETVAPAIHRLRVGAGQGDWMFPYVTTQQGGVGTCAVPAGAPNGTIVVTGGMNGCALHVSQSNGMLHFFHDLNSRSMGGKLVPGELVSQVGYTQYAGSEGAGDGLVARYAASGGAAMPIHYLLTIRVGTVWKVYSSSVLEVRDRRGARSYQSFQPHADKLVGLFAT